MPPQGAYCWNPSSFQPHDGLISESQADAEARAALAETAARVMAAPEPDQTIAPRNPAGRKGKESTDEKENVSRLSYGNSSTYRIAKLKRDHPEVAARVEAGEFKTVAAAERAAGVKPPKRDTKSPGYLLDYCRERLGADSRVAAVDDSLGSSYERVPTQPYPTHHREPVLATDAQNPSRLALSSTG